jgi:hypothetical protein
MTRRFLTLLAVPAALLTLAACEDDPSRPGFTVRHFVDARTADLVCGSGQCTASVGGEILEAEDAGTVANSTVFTQIRSAGSTAWVDGPTATSGPTGAFVVTHAFAETALPLDFRVCAGSAVRPADDLCTVLSFE